MSHKIFSITAAIGLQVLISVIFPPQLYAQVKGCTDPLANNYQPGATTSDSSCTYNTVNYTPATKVNPLSDSVVETSGLQMADNFLWTFNDSGGQPEIYKIDTITNALLQRIILGGAQNTDWEDIAFDGVYLYLGDFGNNANGARTNLRIYRFPISSIPDAAISPVFTIPANLIEQINFTYSDQPQPPQSVAANTTKFDCEAMIVDDAKIHLFTKNWVDLTTTHYIIDGVKAGSYVAMPQETLATNYLVTAADKAPGKNFVILLGYQNTGTAVHFLTLLSAYSNGNYFNGNRRKITLPDALYMGQAEGLSFRDSSYGYISNEKFVRYIGTVPVINVPQKLFAFSVGNYISNISNSYAFIGTGNWSDVANWQHNNVPPASVSPGSKILIDPVTGGECMLDIPYNLAAGATITVANGKAFLVKGNLTITN